MYSPFVRYNRTQPRGSVKRCSLGVAVPFGSGAPFSEASSRTRRGSAGWGILPSAWKTAAVRMTP